MTNDELRELAAKATPGPWQDCGAYDGCGLIWSLPVDMPVATTNTDSDEEGISSTRERKLADAAYIACSPDRILALLDDNARLAARVAALESALVDAAIWLEAEAAFPRQTPQPAMVLQASILRAALAAEEGQ